MLWKGLKRSLPLAGLPPPLFRLSSLQLGRSFLLAFHSNLQLSHLSNFPAVSAEESGKCGALRSLGSEQGLRGSPEEPERRVPQSAAAAEGK